jgi:hypothetical protein
MDNIRMNESRPRCNVIIRMVLFFKLIERIKYQDDKCRFENSIGVTRTGMRVLLLMAYQATRKALAIYICKGPIRRKPAVLKTNLKTILWKGM